MSISHMGIFLSAKNFSYTDSERNDEIKCILHVYKPEFRHFFHSSLNSCANVVLLFSHKVLELKYWMALRVHVG